MILGLTLTMFTVLHTVIGVVGIITGLVVAGGLAAGKRFEPWALVFLVTTIATSLTGFAFPFVRFLPSHAVGVVSLIVLAVVIVAQYVMHFAGAWRPIYAVGVVLATYLNTFVLVTQLFRRLPALIVSAPTQSEPPFTITQALTFLVFARLAAAAVKGFRADPAGMP